MEPDGNGGVSPSGFVRGGHGVARLVLSEREMTFSLTTLQCQRFIAPSASIRSRGTRIASSFDISRSLVSCVLYLADSVAIWHVDQLPVQILAGSAVHIVIFSTMVFIFADMNFFRVYVSSVTSLARAYTT